MSARTRRMGALALCLLLCGGPAALAAPGRKRRRCRSCS